MTRWVESLVQARYLGEDAATPWWGTSVTSPVGRRMLARLSPRTVLSASLVTVSHAAALVHDQQRVTPEVHYTQALAKGGTLLVETRLLLQAWQPGVFDKLRFSLALDMRDQVRDMLDVIHHRGGHRNVPVLPQHFDLPMAGDVVLRTASDLVTTTGPAAVEALRNTQSFNQVAGHRAWRGGSVRGAGRRRSKEAPRPGNLHHDPGEHWGR